MTKLIVECAHTIQEAGEMQVKNDAYPLDFQDGIYPDVIISIVAVTSSSQRQSSYWARRKELRNGYLDTVIGQALP